MYLGLTAGNSFEIIVEISDYGNDMKLKAISNNAK